MYRKLFKESQLHGAKWVAERKYGWLWGVLLLALFQGALLLILATTVRFYVNPTYLIRGEQEIDQGIFPSLHVCPEIQFDDDKVKGFLANIKIPPQFNRSYLLGVFNQLGAFISRSVNYNENDLRNLEHVMHFSGKDIYNTTLLLTSTCEEILLRCYWYNHDVKCTDYFKMILTSDGFCCIFELRSRTSQKLNVIPRKFGYLNSLSVAVTNVPSFKKAEFKFKRFGVFMQLHQYVESAANVTPLLPGYEQHVSMRATKLEIDEDAVNMNDKDKMCRMSSYPLKYFKVYRRSYCLRECYLDRTLNLCGCIPFIHPIPIAPYCRADQLKCLRFTAGLFDNFHCDCPPTCDLVQGIRSSYKFKLDQGSFPLDPFYKDFTLDNISVIRVFLERAGIIRNRRVRYFTLLDYVAQIGGSLNLFFGFSFLTFLEIGFVLKYFIVHYARKFKKSLDMRISLLNEKGKHDGPNNSRYKKNPRQVRQKKKTRKGNKKKNKEKSIHKRNLIDVV